MIEKKKWKKKLWSIDFLHIARRCKVLCNLPEHGQSIDPLVSHMSAWTIVAGRRSKMRSCAAASWIMQSEEMSVREISDLAAVTDVLSFNINYREVNFTRQARSDWTVSEEGRGWRLKYFAVLCLDEFHNINIRLSSSDFQNSTIVQSHAAVKSWWHDAWMTKVRQQ